MGNVKNRIKNTTVRAAWILTFSLSFSPCSVSDDLKEFFFVMAKEVRKTILGPLSPKCSLLAYTKAILQRILPEDSYQLASGRLHISLTRVMDGQNVIASEFSSKEELIEVKRPSCDAAGRSLPTARGGGTCAVMILTALFSSQDGESVRKLCQSRGPITMSSIKLGGKEGDVVRSRAIWE